MAERPRKFWQLHLSTALASMLLASVLLGFNLVERDAKGQYQAWYAKDYDELLTWGWPLELGQSGVMKASTASASSSPQYTEFQTTSVDKQGRLHFSYRNNGMIVLGPLNAAVCGALLIAFAALCEFSIRLELKRRARREQLRRTAAV